MKVAVLVLIVFGLLGCASGQETFYYTLRPLDSNNADERTNRDSPTIGIGPFSFPEWLDQPAVVSYEKDNMLNVPYYQVWAGDLEPMILNVMAANISSLTGWQQVFPFPWDNRHRPEYQIRIHVEEFAGTLGQQVVLKVKWTLLSDQGKVEHFSHAEYLTRALNENSHIGYVNALNGLLNEFSIKVSNELTTFINKES